MKLILLSAFFLASLAGCAQNKPQNTEKQTEMKQTNRTEEQQILDLVRHFTDLSIARNTAEMEKMTDKNYTLTHITGHVQPRAEWFKEIDAESMKYYSYEEVSTSVEIKGDKAVFVGRNRLDARIWGSRNVWRLQQTMTLEKRNGQWIILHSVARTF
ncbi:MAG: nuclear transport factor 2 family protein [Cruoricaptor ignavus]|nr:nuclear transport factor 2 family protein [Cruoricaptor ignavus]